MNNLKQCIEELYPRFEEINEYFEKSEDEFASFCHSQLSGGIGMKIRNKLSLWDETSELHNYFKYVLNIEHPDNMSDLIIRKIYQKWKNQK